MDGFPDSVGWIECLVWRCRVWRRHEGKATVEIPQVSFSLKRHIIRLTYNRASGYLLLPMFLMTAAVGGNYSTWMANNVNLVVRVVVFTVAPIAILAGLWSRVRLSKMNFRG